MKEFRILLEEREINDDLEPISRKTVANQYMSSPIEDDEYYEYAIKQMCQDTIDKFIEQKDEMPSIPVKSIKDYDRELVKEVCEKIEDWCSKNFNYSYGIPSVVYDLIKADMVEKVVEDEV